MKITKVTNKAGLDNFSDHFLKDDANVLANSVSDLRNILVNSGKISESCEIAKLNLHKWGSVTEASKRHLLNWLNFGKELQVSVHYANVFVV